ncbi:MAG: hypothetical protein LBM09_02715 [Candidatus Nomurabacteria bacterium]|nr:hypothetical protein [Candidatus Nomurabacteria bacterium]
MSLTKEDLQQIQEIMQKIAGDLRAEIKESGISLRKEIKNSSNELYNELHREIKESEISLRAEIKESELNLRKEIKESELSLREDILHNSRSIKDLSNQISELNEKIDFVNENRTEDSDMAFSKITLHAKKIEQLDKRVTKIEKCASL